MKNRLISGILTSAVIAFVANAIAVEPIAVWDSEDTAAIIRIKNGFNETVKVYMHAKEGPNAIYVGSTSNALSLSGGTYDTVTEVAAAFRAATNSAGRKLIEVDTDCSLLADNFTNSVITGVTNVINPGDWGTAMKWDTSACRFFQTYIPNSTTVGGVGKRSDIKRITGAIGGSGNITLNIYQNGTKVWQKTIVSPVYVLASMATNIFETTADNVGTGNIDIPLDFPMPRDKNTLIRAARAATATTGGIGAVIEPRD
jgi:hypothetical protein